MKEPQQARHAAPVQRAPTRLLVAQLGMPALATPAIPAFKGLLTAVRVLSAHTRMSLGPQPARLVQLTDRIRRLRLPAFRIVQFSVLQGQRALEMLAQLASPESSRKTQGPHNARSVVLEVMPHKMDCRNAWPAVRASTGLLQHKLLKHRARPAALASTGLLQDKPLRHRARPVVRASTGLLQHKLLKHRARPVPRTRTLLLRAVLKQTAPATQATRGLLEAPASL
jgi:hypothetical protein